MDLALVLRPLSDDCADSVQDDEEQEDEKCSSEIQIAQVRLLILCGALFLWVKHGNCLHKTWFFGNRNSSSVFFLSEFKDHTALVPVSGFVYRSRTLTMYSTHTFRILSKRLARKLFSRGSDYRFPVLFLSCLLLPGRSTAQCTGNCSLNLYQNLSCNPHLLWTKDVSTGTRPLPIQILAQDVFARHHIAKLLLLLVQITM